MKALIGVDVAGEWKIAASLLNRLQFPISKLVILSAVNTMLADNAFPEYGGTAGVGEVFPLAEDAGRNALKKAVSETTGICPDTEQHLILGDATHAIMDIAADCQVDLIAITAHQHGFLEAMLTGSTTKGLLASAHRSILAAKAGGQQSGPVKAIFATDLSDYSLKCLDLFLSMKPADLAQVSVVTVQDNISADDAAKLATVVQKLSTLSASCDCEVVAGEVNAGLRTAMHDRNADLLVIGGHGHGFIDLVRSGSVSFHQALSEDYSVLVLRLPS